jgi:hypothetical protein
MAQPKVRLHPNAVKAHRCVIGHQHRKLSEHNALRKLRRINLFPGELRKASARVAKIAGRRKRGQDTTGVFAPSVTCTISGGTPRRNGMMLQPRPPETMTSHFSLRWP